MNYTYSMNNENNCPAEQLKKAIKDYEKSCKRKIYNELPLEIKTTIKQQAFYQKINRMKDTVLFSDSNLLYEVLRILGIKFESLYDPEGEEAKISYYLNKINESISALRTEQKMNTWFEKNCDKPKITQRTTLIKKLNALLSVWYAIFILDANFRMKNKVSTTVNWMIDTSTLPLLHPSSIYNNNIQQWNAYLIISPKATDQIFCYLFRQFGTKERPKLNKLFAYIGQNEIPVTALSLFGLNYLLLINLLNFWNSYDTSPFNPFNKDGSSIEEYKKLRFQISSLLKAYDNIIDFLDIVSDVSAYQESSSAIEDAYNQLIITENFIYTVVGNSISLWKMYIESIENGVLQQNEIQTRNLQEIQDNEIEKIIKAIREISFRGKPREKMQYAINLFRGRVNLLLSNNPYGTQLITPISKLQYERFISEKLETMKPEFPHKDYVISFVQNTKGFLERFKNYFVRK